MVATARWRRLARRWLVAIAVAGSVPSAFGVNLRLPNKTDSLKFAVIGDFGTGNQPSYEVAAQMAALRARFPFEMVITTGDNIIGEQDDPSEFAATATAAAVPIANVTPVTFIDRPRIVSIPDGAPTCTIRPSRATSVLTVRPCRPACTMV